MSGSPPRNPAVQRLDAAMVVAALAALVSIVIEHGFLPPPPWPTLLRLLDLACVLVFAACQAAKLLVVEEPREYFRTHRLDFSLLFLLAVQTVVHVALRDTPEFRYLERHNAPSPLWAFYVGVLQAYVVAVVVARSHWVHRQLIRLRLKPAQILVVSFLILIALGTCLLLLPGARASASPLGFVDALFTATSAVCVTGLVVRDTGTYFSAMGHTVLVFLIQAGGLGMLTIAGSFVVFRGERLKYSEARTLAEALDVESVREIRQVLARTVWTTLGLEAAGAAVLFHLWSDVVPSPLTRAAWAAFHAVSAFCNAGFSLFPDGASLTAFATDPWTLGVMGLLIVLGGFGFAVLQDLGELVAARGPRRRLTRHTRWVLVLSGVLLAGGALGFYFFERHGALSGLSGPAQWMNACFQSVTLRTAGFNSVGQAALGLPAAALCIVWMLVGGAPGSTAGGMKVTTAGVSLAALVGRPRVDRSTRRRAVRIALAFLAAYVLAGLGLAALEGALHRRLFFEAASALGTVGLSMGVTGGLSAPSKLLLVLAMFAGRVGPFVLAASILPIRDEPPVKRPDRIQVG